MLSPDYLRDSYTQPDKESKLEGQDSVMILTDKFNAEMTQDQIDKNSKPNKVDQYSSVDQQSIKTSIIPKKSSKKPNTRSSAMLDQAKDVRMASTTYG